MPQVWFLGVVGTSIGWGNHALVRHSMEGQFEQSSAVFERWTKSSLQGKRMGITVPLITVPLTTGPLITETLARRPGAPRIWPEVSVRLFFSASAAKRRRVLAYVGSLMASVIKHRS